MRTFTPADIEAWKWNGMSGTPGDPQVTAAGLSRQKASNAARDGGYAFNPDAAPGIYDPNATAKGSLAVDLSPGMSNTRAAGVPAGMPASPTDIPPLGYTTTATTGRLFTGQAPTPTPYGDFTAPDPATFQHSPGFQYNLDEQQKALQRSAAARGSLLSGGLLKRLQANASGLASQDYGDAFNRALGVYTTNRDTNAQNYGQAMGQYRGNLDAFGANTSAGLGWARNDRDAAQQAADQAAQQQQTQSQSDAISNARNAGAVQGLSNQYADWVEQQRRMSAARPTPPPAPPPRGSLGRPRMGYR